VTKQMMRGEWRVVRIYFQPGQIIFDGLVEIEFAFVGKLQNRNGNKRLRNRANLK
jgi:hypothetical protein